LPVWPNIQCENCHGPGNQHIFSQNVVGNTNAITVNYAAGDLRAMP